MAITKQIAISLVTGITLLFACKKSDIEPLPSNHYILSEGVLFPVTDGLTVITDTVQISICPPNANCFAPDNASVSLRISKGAETRSVRLFTWLRNDLRRVLTPSSKDSTSVQLGGQAYKLILKARYVNTEEKNKAGQAIIQVSSL